MKGGGDWWRFIIEKPREIPEQAKLFFRSYQSGHRITTLASIGNWIHKYGKNPSSLLIPLNKILLWHPVRGNSERADASTKTTLRKEEMIKYFETDEQPYYYLTNEVLNTIPSMGSSDSISSIRVIPLLNTVVEHIKEKLKENPANITFTRSLILSIQSDLITKKRLHTDNNFRKGAVFYPYNNSDDIPKLNLIDEYYIISSGQGRVQAIKEAAIEFGIDPQHIFLEITIYDIERNLCSLFSITGNEYRKDKYFEDPRHSLDNKLFPAVETCNQDGPTYTDILSILRELRNKSTSEFNTNTFSNIDSNNANPPHYNGDYMLPNEYNTGNENNTNTPSTTGGRKRTRRKYKKNKTRRVKY